MSQRLRSRALRAGALVLACAAAAAGTSYAGSALTQRDTTVIQACEQQGSGLLRIVQSATLCTRSEIPISWNQPGPAGPAGPPGPAGQDGASLTSLESLQGVACTTQSGDQGTVSVAVGADGAVSLRCTAASQPAAAALTGLSVPSQLFRGVRYTGHVTLAHDVAADTAIALRGAAFLGLPATVTVPAGADTARFDYTPTDTGTGAVTATLGSASVAVAVQVIEPPQSSPTDIPAIAGIGGPASLAPGGDGYLTVWLSGVAPAGGTTVNLATTSGTVDATVTVPAGMAAADAHITAPVTGSGAVVTATLGATTLSLAIGVS